MAEFEKVSYASFVWKFGTTSFRTTRFNKMTEWQLQLIDDFWKKPEYKDYGWDNRYMCPGQEDIYWIKCRYYDWLVENNFMEGGEPETVKYKTAREKTSGLYDMGLLNDNHRLTEVGREILELSKNQDYLDKTKLGISKDSLIYLTQLLKLHTDDTGTTVRPLIVVLYLLSELKYLSYDEFRYLMPLCTDEFSTSYILQFIRDLRTGRGTIDDVIKDFLLLKPNYTKGLSQFLNNEFSPELLLSVGMNRKSPKYDMPYVSLYKELYAVFMEGDFSRIFNLFLACGAFKNSSISIKWRSLLFDTPRTAAVKKDPEAHLIELPKEATKDIESFKRFFYLTMHLNKAKATLEDYLDLNRRYLGLTNCFLFEDNQVKLDVVPKQFFEIAISELYKQAYQKSPLLFVKSNLEDICPLLHFDEEEVIKRLNIELGTHFKTIEEAYDEVEKLRYERFNRIVDSKFSNETLLSLLDCFDNRDDVSINQLVTDNADAPTIFEYILGIIWWKASGRKGRILDFLKLSLDSNLLPITHAAGGEADIVYEYEKSEDYPEHTVLLEATLADGTNQRRMEMEPVSRHLGNHLLRNHNLNSYAIFASTFLHVNVIGDFRVRKYVVYCDSQDPNDYITGMKIVPISTNDLRYIINEKVSYTSLYKHFSKAFKEAEMHPHKWYENYVCLETSNFNN